MIPKAASIVANTLSTNAFEAMKENIEYNGVDYRVTHSCQEARWTCPRVVPHHWFGVGGGGGGEEDCGSVGLFHLILGIDIV